MPIVATASRGRIASDEIRRSFLGERPLASARPKRRGKRKTCARHRECRNWRRLVRARGCRRASGEQPVGRELPLHPSPRAHRDDVVPARHRRASVAALWTCRSPPRVVGAARRFPTQAWRRTTLPVGTGGRFASIHVDPDAPLSNAELGELKSYLLHGANFVVPRRRRRAPRRRHLERVLRRPRARPSSFRRRVDRSVREVTADLLIEAKSANQSEETVAGLVVGPPSPRPRGHHRDRRPPTQRRRVSSGASSGGRRAPPRTGGRGLYMISASLGALADWVLSYGDYLFDTEFFFLFQRPQSSSRAAIASTPTRFSETSVRSCTRHGSSTSSSPRSPSDSACGSSARWVSRIRSRS